METEATQTPIEPKYVTSEVNSSVSLYSGPIRLEWNGESFDGDGNAELQLLPSPRISVSLRLSRNEAKDSKLIELSMKVDEFCVELVNRNVSSSVLRTKSSYSTQNGLILEGILNEEVIAGERATICAIDAYFLNVGYWKCSPNAFVHTANNLQSTRERLEPVSKPS